MHCSIILLKLFDILSAASECCIPPIVQYNHLCLYSSQVEFVSHWLNMLADEGLVVLYPGEGLSEEPLGAVEARRLTRAGEVERETLLQRTEEDAHGQTRILVWNGDR